MKMQRLLFFSLILLLAVSACRKNVEEIVEEETPYTPPVLEEWDPPYDPVKGDLTGVVTDETGEPVAGATIKLGELNTITNQFGFFLFKDVDLNARGSLVQVNQEGFFPGSRRVFAVDDAVNRVKIELIKKSFEYSINTETGGEIEMNGGAKVLFAPNSIRNADGTPYIGDVRIAAKWLDPEALSTVNRMPGSLQGVSFDSEEVALSTAGMMVVEMEDNNGQPLNIRDGYTATIAMPVPSNLLPNAPASIPNWSYNEEYGVWVEEGVSYLEGNYYVGKVSHFSYWNHDFKGPLVEFTLTVVHESGLPLEGYLVVIRIEEEGLSGSGLTCDRGIVSGLIPADYILQLEIYGQCGNIIYEAEIGPYTANADLGTIVLDETIIPNITTGELVDCNGDPIANGLVLIEFSGITYMEYTDGSPFTAELTLCSQTENVHIKGYDLDAELQSNTIILPPNEQINAGQIFVCQTVEDYILLNVEGTQERYFPAFAGPDSLGDGTVIRFDLLDQTVIMNFDGEDVGDYSGESNNFIEYISDVPNGWTFEGNFFEFFEVTAYGDIGEPITGSFSGTLTNYFQQPETDVIVTGEFSIIRDQ